MHTVAPVAIRTGGGAVQALEGFVIRPERHDAGLLPCLNPFLRGKGVERAVLVRDCSREVREQDICHFACQFV